MLTPRALAMHVRVFGRWAEGELLVFDDSYEHEVWNETDLPRLVLIVDLWHPRLDTDAKRAAVLDAARAERYRKIISGEPLEEYVAAPELDAARAGGGGVWQHCASMHASFLGLTAAGVSAQLVACLDLDEEANGGTAMMEDAAVEASERLRRALRCGALSQTCSTVSEVGRG